MTMCKACGQNLNATPVVAAADVKITDFLQDKPDMSEPMARKGESGYTEKYGYLLCECGRDIPVTPKIIQEGYDGEKL